MKAADQHQVLAILTEVITPEGVEWHDIVKAVSAEMKIKNWLDVRGILQYMLNKKLVARDPNVRIEAYSKVVA